MWLTCSSIEISNFDTKIWRLSMKKKHEIETT